MSRENPVLVLSGPAAEDLSNDQYRWVVLGTTGYRRPDSETEVLAGILQNAPAAGQAAAVMVLGVSKLQLNDALGIGSFVKTEYVSAADAGKGKDAAAALAYARAIVLEASAAEDDLGSVLLIGPLPAITQVAWQQYAVATEATAGAVTHAVADLLGGLILRDPNGAARADLFPTAALIVAGIAGAVVGSGFPFTIRNTADADEPITMTTNTGLTLSGDMVIGRNRAKRFLAVVTNAGAGTEAVSIYAESLEPPVLAAVTTTATAGAVTHTAAQILGGLILRDPAGANRADLFPTAANIVAALPGCVVGQTFDVTILNTADAEEIINMTTNTGLTLSGDMAIERYRSKTFRVVLTNVTVAAVTIYALDLAEKPRTAVTTEATAAAVTFTAAQILGGLILRDPAGAARADLLPAPADIVAAIPGCVVGSSFEFTIRNTADANETITLTANGDSTVSGTATIAQNNSKRFLAVVTNIGSGTEAVTVYSLGTVVH
jgi:hypothetical protein